MTIDYQQESLVNKTVTYTLEINGQFILVENVPARVNEETGEQFFAPETVERLQAMILGDSKPLRFMEIPVYHYTEVA